MDLDSELEVPEGHEDDSIMLREDIILDVVLVVDSLLDAGVDDGTDIIILDEEEVGRTIEEDDMLIADEDIPGAEEDIPGPEEEVIPIIGEDVGLIAEDCDVAPAEEDHILDTEFDDIVPPVIRVLELIVSGRVILEELMVPVIVFHNDVHCEVQTGDPVGCMEEEDGQQSPYIGWHPASQ